MSIVTRTEMIPTPDGGEMQAYVALPEAGSGPGLVVLMEIFGAEDQYIPAEQAETVAAAAAQRPAWEQTRELPTAAPA